MRCPSGSLACSRFRQQVSRGAGHYAQQGSTRLAKALTVCRRVGRFEIFLVFQAIDLWISDKIFIIGQRRAIRIIGHHLAGTHLVGSRAATQSDCSARHGFTRTQGRA